MTQRWPGTGKGGTGDQSTLGGAEINPFMNPSLCL